MFVADSLKADPGDGTVSDIDSFREALLKSINALNDSDASEFFSGYFDIVVAEPVNPDGTSLHLLKPAVMTGMRMFIVLDLEI